MKIEGSTLGGKGFNPRNPWETSLIKAFLGVNGWWQNPQLSLSQDPPPESRDDVAEINSASPGSDHQQSEGRKRHGTYRPNPKGQGLTIFEEGPSTFDTLG